VYLPGLFHDVGQLALLTFPLYDSARLEGLERKGCPLVRRNLLLRSDHASFGARTIDRWYLPEVMVAADRYHYRPEKAKNALASLLYLAKLISERDEDLPSFVRIAASMKETGLTWDAISDCTVSRLGRWLAAAA